MLQLKVFDSIAPLMNSKSRMTDVCAFHERVNITFHDIEAEYYDKLHREMWKSLPIQFEILVDDLMSNNFPLRNIHLLDIGCGTGLSTELLLKTKIGKRISRITLLDTSSKMLGKAKIRSKNWNKNVSIKHGDLSVIDEKFHFILISSVLHHIPNLEDFFEKIDDLQEKGNYVMTIHDPLSEAISSEIYKDRCNSYSKSSAEWQKNRPLLRKVFDKVKTTFSKEPNYIQEVNFQLMKEGIIEEPLTAQEIWSVTDIHVEDLPFSNKAGISLKSLESILRHYTLTTTRTYGFFGQAQSNLKLKYYEKEQELILAGDRYGRNFGSIWEKN